MWIKVNEWCDRHLTQQQKVLLLSFVIGLLSGFAALLLHSLIAFFQRLVSSYLSITHINWIYLVLPIVGIMITALIVRYIIKDNIQHGITRVLYAISRKGGKIRGHNTWSSMLTSAITIGFGGSVGAEAPIVFTGSAIGSNLGKAFRMDTKTLTLLIGCGAAGAVAGIFKAPIAGLVFTVEVLMIDLTMSSLLPLLISSITATSLTYIFTDASVMFTYQPSHDIFSLELSHIPNFVIFGIFCGLISLYFIKMSGICEKTFARLKKHFYAKILIGGSLLSILIFFFPSLYGEGYQTITLILNGRTTDDFNAMMNGSFFAGYERYLFIYVALVILLKVIATSATTGAGGVGGIFAPTLFLGALCGLLATYCFNKYGNGAIVTSDVFALLGMAGLMSGVMHAPLTGIFLIAELTGGYKLMLPLMIVSVCSYLTIKIFVPHSIYANQLARQGILLTHHTDHTVLTLMNLDLVIDKEIDTVSPDMYLGELVRALSNSHNSVLAVTRPDGGIIGEVDVRNIRHIIFRTELYQKFQVSQIMSSPKAILSINDPMNDVMDIFEKTHAEHLPVEDENNVLKGYITREKMYSMYRKMVADLSEE